MAGMQNSFTRTMTDIVWTSADPEVYDYRENANGDVYNIVRQIYNGEIDISTESGNGRYLNTSLRRYCEDCVAFEVLRPQSDLNANMFSTSSDLTELLEAAQSPSVFTVYFDETNPAGTAMNCADAYDRITGNLNGITDVSEENMNFWRIKCVEAGYRNSEGMIGQDQIERCMQRTTQFLSFITEGDVSPSEVTRNLLIANELWNAALNTDIATLGDYKIGTALMGEAISTDRWLPVDQGGDDGHILGSGALSCDFIANAAYRSNRRPHYRLFLFSDGLGGLRCLGSQLCHGLYRQLLR